MCKAQALLKKGLFLPFAWYRPVRDIVQQVGYIYISYIFHTFDDLRVKVTGATDGQFSTSALLYFPKYTTIFMDVRF